MNRHPSDPVRRIVRIGIFTAIALTIHAAESYIPVPVPIPGVRLGLANCITLMMLQLSDPLEAALVLLLRIFLGTVFAGQAVSLMYAAFGGCLCYAVLYCFCRFLNGKYLPIQSAAGALAHNTGQILAALLLTRTAGVLAYYPVLVISGVITGVFTGLASMYACRVLQNIPLIGKGNHRKDPS